jgi:hypothetical protein
VVRLALANAHKAAAAAIALVADGAYWALVLSTVSSLHQLSGGLTAMPGLRSSQRSGEAQHTVPAGMTGIGWPLIR